MVAYYATLKSVHLFCALLSIAGFLWRAGLAVQGSSQLSHRLWRVLPHVNDTVLLLCGVAMAVLAGFNPLQHHWLAGKLVLLVAYIVCGLFVLKWARTRTQQLSGTVLALCCFAGMGWLAVFKPL